MSLPDYYSIKIELDSGYTTSIAYQIFHSACFLKAKPKKPRVKHINLKRKLIKLESVIDSAMSTSLDRESISSFDIFGSVFEGQIKLFKLSNSNVTYNQHSETLVKDEVVKKVVDENNVMACIIFEPQIMLLDVLKKIFPTGDSLKAVTHVRCLKQLSVQSEVKNSFTLLDESGEDQGYHDNLLLVNFTNTENKNQFSLEFDGYEIKQTLLKVVNIKEVVFTAKLFQTISLAHEGESSTKSDYNSPSFRNQPVLPYLIEDPFTKENNSFVSNIELPTCPVCLDRLDSATTGIITTNCQHAFHCKCLMKWKNSKCPVCRYTLDQTNRNEKKCNQCDARTNLWCCLICGHVGCSRYSSKHAIDHYKDSGHCFSVDLNTSRVWDYAEDKYVHRLVQNISDGKLVEISGTSNGFTGNQRDSVTSENAKKGISNNEDNLEYIQLLLSQLESQQTYYENKLSTIKQEKKKDLEVVCAKWEQKFKSLEQKAVASDLQFKNLHESIEVGKQTNVNLLTTLQAMKDEIKSLKTHNEKLEREKLEQEENTKDLMFHMEAMSKLNNLDGPLSSANSGANLAGHIVIKEATEANMNTLEAKKRKNKKKNEKKKLKKLQMLDQS